MKWFTGALIVLFLLWCAPADAARRCKVVSVTDGDTFTCTMTPPLWGPYRNTIIRVADIDTPESLKTYAKCDKELRLGLIAKAEAKRRLPIGSTVSIVWTGEKEFHNRVLARVKMPDGADWAGEMIRLGMARPYTSDNLTKQSWCN